MRDTVYADPKKELERAIKLVDRLKKPVKLSFIQKWKQHVRRRD